MKNLVRTSALALGLSTMTGMAVASVPASAQQASSLIPAGTHQSGTTLPGTDCPAFPADNVWNTSITGLPVNADSSSWLASMDASTTFLHPDFGPSGNKSEPYGIPWQIVSPSQSLIPVKFTYASQSDPGPYPLSKSTPIENDSDRHAVMVNPSSCTLYELWDTRYHARKESTAGSGAIWSLQSDALRPAGWTSADAAGLPILPGLVNYDEVTSGSMDHAIRFTAECTQQAYIWPARHEAGQDDADCPPMGARFRLSAGFVLPASECSAMCQTVITTMKTYGLILADNGSDWYFQGTADTRWTDKEVDQLKQIPASDSWPSTSHASWCRRTRGRHTNRGRRAICRAAADADPPGRALSTLICRFPDAATPTDERDPRHRSIRSDPGRHRPRRRGVLQQRPVSGIRLDATPRPCLLRRA